MSEDFLRRVPLFAGLPDEAFIQLVQMARPLAVRGGELLMVEGSPGDSLYVIMEGRFRASKRSGQEEVTLAECGPGDVLGEISLLDLSPRTATVRAIEDSALLMIDQRTFKEVIASSPTAVLAILRTVTSRLRNTEAMLVQSEKMAALGTLAAGLAHELNNPAAAARRSATLLRTSMHTLLQRSAALHVLDFTPHQVATLDRLREEIERLPEPAAQLDPLIASDRESEFVAWLDEHSVDADWEVAPALVAAGWDVAKLQGLTAEFAESQLAGVIQWLTAGMSNEALLQEVGESASRISEIVKAVKSYAYLDQAPVQNIDIPQGLDNTLVILRHKLKAGITVVKEYEVDLPRIEAYGSELNQVWTNLLDNAIDAMQGLGILTLRALRDGEWVVVDICDDGPVISPEIQSRIFDPFFTTKPLGEGTGLGLHITYNVVQKHRGHIRVTSQPTSTCFEVRLPLQLRRPG
jgi:signal transduction histidine kinase